MTTSWGPTDLVFQNLLNLEKTHTKNEKEEDRHPSYCLSWSKHIRKDAKSGQKLHLFACCGGEKAVIVAVEKDNADAPWQKCLTVIDDDPNEKFRASAFGGRSICGSSFLILGGKAAKIKLWDIDRGCLAHMLHGHRGVINDLKISPMHDSLLLSAAGDRGIRLWNLDLDVLACVAVFGGAQYGHQKAVLSVSWHFEGEKFASSGADGYVRLWNGLSDSRVVEALHAIRPMPGEPIVRERAYYDSFPRFVSNQLHVSPVDCVHWMRDGRILSKCMDNVCLFWKPDYSNDERLRQKVEIMGYPPAKDFSVFTRFEVSCRHNFFSRFSVDPLDEQQLAVGELGTNSIWNLDHTGDHATVDDDDCLSEGDDYLDFNLVQTLSIPNLEKVRAVAYSPHGNLLIACSDEGNLYRWRPGPPVDAMADVPIKTDAS